MNFDDLPDSWEITNLENLIVFVLGGDWGNDFTDTIIDDYTPVRVIRGTEVKNWIKDKGNTATTRIIKISSLEKRQLKENDLIIEISGGGPLQSVGRTLLIDKEALELSEYPLICANFFRQVRLHNFVNPKFICIYINFLNKTGELEHFQTQTTNLRNLNFPSFIKDLKFVFPPLNEQKRIVEKIELIQEHTRKVKSELDNIKVKLKRLRRSLLASAFRGDLTKDWRADHPDIESATVLLERIKKERREKWEQAELEKMRAKGITPKDDKWKSKYSEPQSVKNIDDLPNIPDEWLFTTIEQVTLFYQNIQPQNFPEEEYIYIDIGSINNSNQKIENSKNFLGKDAPSRAKRVVKENDILFSTVRTYLKNIAVVPENLDGVLTSTGICILRPSKFIHHKFIFYFVISDDFINKISNTMDGTLYPAISDSDLYLSSIYLPPLEEQKEIVRKLEKMMQFADRVEERVKEAEKKLDEFNQSVLAKAFRGKLVPQDPNDEPASVLLGKIQQEKNSTTSKKIKK